MGSVQEIRQKIDVLWVDRNIKFKSSGWHGYTVNGPENIPTIFLFCESKGDASELVNSISNLGKVIIERMPQFRMMQSGANQSFPDPFQAGNLVVAVGTASGCRGCTGTIGAFLRLKPHKDDDQIWLLSCRHILDHKFKCTNPQIEFRGAQDIVLSQGPVKVFQAPQGLFLDAALIPVDHGRNKYDPLLRISDITPIPLQENTPVRKQGNATNVTSGLYFRHCDKMSVIDCHGNEQHDIINELMIGSLISDDSSPDPDPFLDIGDSGSLVVSENQPAGILLAIAHRDKSVVENPKVKIPFGLAIPLDVVLSALSPLVDPSRRRTLEMLLPL